MKKKLVILTGAGISAESGIPTFRDAVTGLWENASIEEVCVVGCLKKNAENTYRFYKELHDKYKDCKPNQAHNLLKKSMKEKYQTSNTWESNKDWAADSKAIAEIIDKFIDKYFPTVMNIDSLIKNATLSRDKVALNAYKNIKTELQKVLTAKNAPEYSEALLIQVTAKYAKSLEDAISQFSEAHRDDLVASYTSELEVVKKLLPAPVNESQIYSELTQWAKLNCEQGLSTKIIIYKKEMGTVIKYLKSKFPTADGKMISEIVKKYVV